NINSNSNRHCDSSHRVHHIVPTGQVQFELPYDLAAPNRLESNWKLPISVEHAFVLGLMLNTIACWSQLHLGRKLPISFAIEVQEDFLEFRVLLNVASHAGD